MTGTNEREVIEKSENVIVVDEKENVYKLSIKDGQLVKDKDIPDELYEWVLDNTSYTRREDFNWPIEIEISHHLEDMGYRPVLSELTDLVGEYQAEKIFQEEMDESIDFPSIEIISVWRIYENGEAKIVRFKYNNTKYTKQDLSRMGHQP